MAKKNTKPSGKAKQNRRRKQTGAAPAPRRNAAPAPRGEQEDVRQKNQRNAVLLFAAALLTGCFVLIPGEHIWSKIHDLLLGLFGNCAILLPILLIYIAVITSLEKHEERKAARFGLMALVIVLFCSAFFVFSIDSSISADHYGQKLAVLFGSSALHSSSGLCGGLLGIPLVAGLGLLGSRIFIVLALFAALMILTETTLMQFFRAIAKPADAVVSNINSARERRAKEQERQQAEIDIPLDAEFPAHPVHSSVFTAGIPEKSVPAKKNDKLEYLKKVFSIGQDAQKKKDEADAGKPDAATSPAPQAPSSAVSDVLPEKMVSPDVRAEEPEAAVQQNPVETIPSQPGPDSPEPGNTGDFLRYGTDTSPENSGSAAPAVPVRPVVKPEPVVQVREKAEPAKEPLKPEKTPAVSTEPPADGIYHCPPVTMLETTKGASEEDIRSEIETNGNRLVSTLNSFGVSTTYMGYSRGPAVTRYELQPAPGVKISRITSLSDDLSMNLATAGIRIEAPIPGKAAVGIEVPNKNNTIVRMRELVESNSFLTAKSKLTVALGRDIAGEVAVADLGKMPHLLIAGATGSGKSVCINSMIISLLYKSKPEEVRFLMIDPKVVELGVYNGIPQLLVPVVNDPRKAAGALSWAVAEMLKRYKAFAASGVRDLKAYNALAESNGEKDENGQPMEKMPQIVIIIDELADLMMAAPSEVEDSICRLAQMARAAGMHLVIATQRPSVDVITGIIKANIPSRIAFAVSSQVDSRTILDMGGAEHLLGRGDMLFSPVGSQKPRRIQGCFVSDSEIESIVGFIKKSQQADYNENIAEEIERNAAADSKNQDSAADSGGEDADPMMPDAIKFVVDSGQASTSMLQRRFRLGYARAGRLVDQMEQMGIVGKADGSKPRQVLITYQQWLEMNMQKDSAPKEESKEN